MTENTTSAARHRALDENSRYCVVIAGSEGWNNQAIIASAILEAWVEREREPMTLLLRGDNVVDQLAAQTIASGHAGIEIEYYPLGSFRSIEDRNAAMFIMNVDLCLGFVYDNQPGASRLLTLARNFDVPTRLFTITNIPASL